MEKLSEIIHTCIIFLVISAEIFYLPAETTTVRQIMVSSEEANWNAVVSGQAVCTPELTSYGFAVLTEGRMISACTDTGTILWQRAVPGRPDPFLTVLDGDFLLTVNDGHTLSFTNPSGLTLWSSIVPFSIISAPYKGRDGRVFVRGRKDIACYSIKGICKWHLSTEQQSLLPLTELPDGSLVVFLMQPAGDKTAAVRISPFGEILEQITFAGIVTSTASCSDGLLLTFSGGGAGLCSIQNNDVRSVWALPSDNSIFSGAAKNDNTFFLASGSSRAVLVQPLSENAKITLFNTGSGTVLSTLIVPNININKTVYKAVSENNYLIADDNHAVLISDSGDCRWSALLPQKNSSSTSWNYLTYTANGFLVLCRTSWAVTGYRMIQNFPSTYNFENTIKKKDYSTFIQSDNQNNISFKIWSITGDLGSGLTGDGRRRELLNGMYGINEIKWTKELFDAGHAYLYFLHNSNSGGRTKPSVFSTDITGTDRMLSQLSLYGTDTFQPLIAQLINYEKNRTLMHTLIETAGSCGYDPDDKLLNSLDNALFSISARDDVLLFSLCDAVYSICRFMGRPAFYKHGREILSKMLYPQYDNRVHVYARKTLTNISGLKL